MSSCHHSGTSPASLGQRPISAAFYLPRERERETGKRKIGMEGRGSWGEGVVPRERGKRERKTKNREKKTDGGRGKRKFGGGGCVPREIGRKEREEVTGGSNAS